MTATVDDLLDLLDVRPEGDNVFSGTPSGSALPRVFGGQVIGQALAAAGRHGRPATSATLPARLLPARRVVGRADRVRRVDAARGPVVLHPGGAGQPGRRADLHHDGLVPRGRTGTRPSGPGSLGPASGDPPSNADRPEDWPDIYREWSSVDITSTSADDRGRPVRGLASWMRVTAPLPDDPLLHACVLACISDLTLLSVTLVPHAIPPRHEDYLVASLDHSVWFHRRLPGRRLAPLRPDHTVHVGLPRASRRADPHRGRHLVASVAQEGLVRARQRGANRWAPSSRTTSPLR